MSLKNTFANAFRGLWFFLRTEPNNRVHLLLSLLAIAAGAFFEIARGEWLAIILSMVLVFSAEAFNASVERLCDKLHPQKDPRMRNIKDVSAAAVLIAALGALAVAAVVFLPRIIRLF